MRLYVGIDSVGVGLQEEAHLLIGRDQVSLGGLAQAQRAHEAIDAQGRLTEDGAEGPAPDPAVHLHLPQPILSVDIALGEEQVMLVLGIDVGYAPFVPEHLHRRRQARD